MESQSEVVAGVDGSPESAAALRWAADYAKLTGARLHVVYAWAPPAVAALTLPPLLDWSALRESAAQFSRHDSTADSQARIARSALTDA